MADLITDCPHCSASRASIRISYAEIVKHELDNASVVRRYRIDGWMAGRCGSCDKPITASFYSYSDGDAKILQSMLISAVGPVERNCKIKQIWSEKKKPDIPAYLDQNVERAYLQAEKNFLIDGMEESSAAMYRRAMELTFKTKLGPIYVLDQRDQSGFGTARNIPEN